MKEKTDNNFFTTGIIGAPFGIKGFSRLKSLSGESAHFDYLKKVILKKAGKEEAWEVAELIRRENSILIRFSGIENPEKAAELSGAELLVPREYAAPLKDDEFYIEDLKGLEVNDTQGEKLGFISNILEGGGGHLAEMSIAQTGKEIKKLIPFRKEFFGVPDFKKGKIELLEQWILE